jgi:hypothetical protein
MGRSTHPALRAPLRGGDFSPRLLLGGSYLVGFEVFDEFGDGGGEDFVSGGGDEHVIFDADADAFPAVVDFGLSFGGFDVGGDIDAGFDGDDVAWLELVPGFGTVHVDSRVVDV